MNKIELIWLVMVTVMLFVSHLRINQNQEMVWKNYEVNVKQIELFERLLDRLLDE